MGSVACYEFCGEFLGPAVAAFRDLLLESRR